MPMLERLQELLAAAALELLLNGGEDETAAIAIHPIDLLDDLAGQRDRYSFEACHVRESYFR
jgi:hypothetical protein